MALSLELERHFVRLTSGELPFASRSPELARHSPEILLREL
jgi:hypothetical protein